jgi:hypothetical protein
VKSTFFVLLLLLHHYIFAFSVNVAPILYNDETGSSSTTAPQVQQDLLGALWAIETGVILRFEDLSNNRINPPQSLTEAFNVCRVERIEYLLYGYVTRRTHSLQMEIRLFSFENRSLMQSFFGMDDSDNYMRLINDMAQKILTFLGESFELEISPVNISTTRVSIPLSAGYWTPLESSWFDLMMGTVNAGTGIELTPTDNLFVIRGLPCYFTIGLDLKYRLGTGNPSGYEAYNHTFYITMPVRFHMRFARRHSIFIGAGFVYFLEYFLMADKYDESRSFLFHNTGLNACIGYQFLLGKRVSMFFRNDFDFLFNEKSLITYSPVLGFNFHVHVKEERKRW